MPRPRHYSLIYAFYSPQRMGKRIEASGVFAVRWLMGLPTRPINLLIETSLRTCGFDVSKKVIPTIPLHMFIFGSDMVSQHPTGT